MKNALIIVSVISVILLLVVLSQNKAIKKLVVVANANAEKPTDPMTADVHTDGTATTEG